MTLADASPSSLRERTRKAVAAEIMSHAMQLFTEQGFDATTIDEIAAASGISSRSFFRYFATKEDVVIGDPLPYGLIVQAALSERPRGEAPWLALRNALTALVDIIHSEPVTSLQASAIMLSTPSLRARHLEKQLVWEGLLVPDISRRLGARRADTPLRAHAVVASALACLDAALNQWVATGGSAPIETLLDTAMSSVSG